MTSDEAPRLQPASPPSPSSSPPARGESHRLHPLSLLFQVGATLKGMAVPLLVVFFASRRSNWDVYLLVVGGISLLHAIFRYLTFRYRFDADELVVQQGLIFRSERHVPYERIHNVDLRQGVLHRLLDVADVRIETASGHEAEADMSVLSSGAVEQMRSRLFSERAARRGAAPAHEVTSGGDDRAEPSSAARSLLHLRARHLVLFGLISNRGLAVVLGVLGVLIELGSDLSDQDWWPANVLQERLSRVEREIEQRLQEELEPRARSPVAPGDAVAPPLSATLEEAAATALVWLAVLVAALLLLRVLSIAWALVNLWDFRLVRQGDDLRTSCGLLTRLAATIPRGRIQVVTVTESLLHRLAGRVSVKADTAGGSSLERSRASRRWIAPLIRRDELPALLAELHPEVRLDAVTYQPVHPAAWRRLAFRWLLLHLLLGGLAVWRWGPWALLPALLSLALAMLDARRRAAHMGFAIDEHFVFVRRGLLTRRTRIVRHPKVAVLSLSTSPFDRRWGTATLTVDTAGTEQPVALPFVPAAEAQAVLERLAGRAAATAFHW